MSCSWRGLLSIYSIKNTVRIVDVIGTVNLSSDRLFILKDSLKNLSNEIPNKKTVLFMEGSRRTGDNKSDIVYFLKDEAIYAADCFGIIIGRDSDLTVKLGSDLDQEIIAKNIIRHYGLENFTVSHYFYLDKVLNEFWELVFGKGLNETFCGGIVTSHGDKLYDCRSLRKEKGIPFFHAAAIFLLTYTSEMDREKHLSREFIIDKYEHYRPVLEKVDNVSWFYKRIH